MEGYSVTEAASVLGVPTERVWELLARGVLAGAPEGESGMRVFLQPRPAPPAVEQPRRENGNGGRAEPQVELSPFRELLTEFRNLTERYGQALLALGEARGEVASLRSRVDLLEARMDLRLPPSAPTSWAPPAPTSPQATVTDEPPPASRVAEAEIEGEHDVEATSRRRRRGHRRATDDFAEALARAEDPSPAVLPGAEEAGVAFAALREEVRHEARAQPVAEPDVPETSLPRELPVAEAIAVAEPEAPAERTTLAAPAEAEPAESIESVIEVEPQPVSVEPQPATVEPSELVWPPGPARPEPTAEAELEPAVEPEVAAAAEPEPQAAVVPEPPVQAAVEPSVAAATEAEPAIEPEVEAVVESEPHAAVTAEPEVAVVPDAAEAREAERDSAPSTTQEPPLPEPEAIAETAVAVEPDRLPEAALLGDLASEVAAEEVGAEPEAEATFVEPSVAIESEPVAYAEREPEPTPEAAEGMPEPEPIAEPADLVADETEEAPAEPALEPTWDEERYTSQIPEPDWWAPEDEPWAEAGGSSVEPSETPEAGRGPESRSAAADVVEEAQPEAAERQAEPGVVESASGRPIDAQPDAFDEETTESPWVEPGAYRSEETMLWLGDRSPAPAPASSVEEGDAAEEMEVASTGRQAGTPPSPSAAGEPASGAGELDDALAALDALARSDIGPTRPSAPQPRQTGYRPSPSIAPRAASAAPGAGPASRAYRRLRRIFPG